MANFATTADLEAFLQVSITTLEQIAAASRALTEASETIRNYTRQQIDLVVNDVVTLDSPGGSKVFLPELPVISVASVVEDAETLTVTDNYILGQYGILHRVSRRWATGIQIVTVTYTHGYSVIPDDIVAVCVRIASRAYQAGLRASEAGGVPGVSSKSLGDYSVSYSGESGGGASEGVLGASAARMILMSEKDILERYRIMRP